MATDPEIKLLIDEYARTLEKRNLAAAAIPTATTRLHHDAIEWERQRLNEKLQLLEHRLAWHIQREAQEKRDVTVQVFDKAGTTKTIREMPDVRTKAGPWVSYPARTSLSPKAAPSTYDAVRQIHKDHLAATQTMIDAAARCAAAMRLPSEALPQPKKSPLDGLNDLEREHVETLAEILLAYDQYPTIEEATRQARRLLVDQQTATRAHSVSSLSEGTRDTLEFLKMLWVGIKICLVSLVASVVLSFLLHTVLHWA